MLRLHGTLLRLLADFRVGDKRDDRKRIDVRALQFGAQVVLEPNAHQGVWEALGTVAVIVGDAYEEELAP